MRTLLPVLDADPPSAYVDFVARHLSGLRSATLRAVDDTHRADLLYPVVLTDVALAWRRLETARHRGHPEAAGDYLDQCLHRRVYGGIDGEESEAGDGRHMTVEFEVWDARDSALPNLPPPGRQRQNAAIRLAEYLLPHVDQAPAPLAEAAIAWWHAYEVRRRRRQVLALVALVVFLLYPVALASNSGAGF